MPALDCEQITTFAIFLLLPLGVRHGQLRFAVEIGNVRPRQRRGKADCADLGWRYPCANTVSVPCASAAIGAERAARLSAKAARALNRAALETNCRTVPVPFINYPTTKFPFLFRGVLGCVQSTSWWYDPLAQSRFVSFPAYHILLQQLVTTYGLERSHRMPNSVIEPTPSASRMH